MLTQDFDQLLTCAETELIELTERRAVLEAEQTKLLRAHLADAVPLDVLKREQDRIRAELEQIGHRITAHHGDYAEAKAHLDDGPRPAQRRRLRLRARRRPDPAAVQPSLLHQGLHRRGRRSQGR